MWKTKKQIIWDVMFVLTGAATAMLLGLLQAHLNRPPETKIHHHDEHVIIEIPTEPYLHLKTDDLK